MRVGGEEGARVGWVGGGRRGLVIGVRTANGEVVHTSFTKNK